MPPSKIQHSSCHTLANGDVLVSKGQPIPLCHSVISCTFHNPLRRDSIAVAPAAAITSIIALGYHRRAR